jgi:hypothetical protein
VSEGPTRPGRIRVLGLLTVVAIAVGCGGDVRDGEDTEVAGVVIERDDPSEARTDPVDGIEVAAGRAGTGITWSVIEGDWVGLGARTLDDAGATQHLVVDVAVDDEVDGVLRVSGCEVTLQAPDDAPLVVRGDLEVALVVESPTGEVRRTALDPAVLDLVLAPGELYRAALPNGGGIEVDAGQAAEVRCEGRFSHT